MRKRNIRRRINVLLPKNSFLVGFGSVINVAGSYFEYNYSNSERLADYKSLKSDWENVGKDFKKSKVKFENINKKELSL